MVPMLSDSARTLSTSSGIVLQAYGPGGPVRLWRLLGVGRPTVCSGLARISTMSEPTRARIRSTPLGAAAVLSAVFAWSLVNVVVKIVHVPAVTFAFYRLWVSAGLMGVALAVARRRLTWAQVRASVPGGLLFGLNIVFFFSALRRT